MVFRKVTSSNVRMEKRKNGKAVGKGEAHVGVNWIWRLCSMAFEKGAALEDWRCTVYKSKGERNECKNYLNIRLSSVVDAIDAEY